MQRPKRKKKKKPKPNEEIRIMADDAKKALNRLMHKLKTNPKI
jgi:hypothetical protein